VTGTIVLLVLCLWTTVGAAQELSPRAFWPAPEGTKVAIVGWSYSTGDVLMDPSLPIYGVDSKIDTAFLGYLQTFSLWGRTTNVVVKRFKPGFWASLDLNYFKGGRQTIGGERLADVQRNSRVGGTIVVPFHGRHAVKVGYSTGVVTDFGTDFNQFLVSYQVLF